MIAFRKIGIFFLLSFFFLTGCAALSPQRDEPMALKNRVAALHQAKVEGDWSSVYDFFYSGYREKRTKTQFLSKPKGMNFKNFEVGKVEIAPSGDSATVEVKEDFSYQGYEFDGYFKPQTWVKENGEWVFKLDPKAKPFSEKP
jgi:hypothetical protein